VVHVYPLLNRCPLFEKNNEINIGGDGVSRWKLTVLSVLAIALAYSVFPSQNPGHSSANAIGAGNAEPGNARLRRAFELYEKRRVYRRGCSEFVSEVLKIPWRSANSLMGKDPESIGVSPHYRLDKVSPGDVLGWRPGDAPDGVAHVCIYIGTIDCMFMDVRNPGARPRKRTSGYGRQELFKSSAY